MPNGRSDRTDESWLELRVCEGQPTSWWFPDREVDPTDYHSARMFCSVCLVSQECLNYAIDNGIRHGMWGGLAPEARRKIKRRRLEEVA